jgi:hypothetical protein
MDGLDRSPWFVGDLEDPWVLAIADALPRGAPRMRCSAELPSVWPAPLLAARTLVLHRPALTSVDAERLRRLRAREGPPIKIVLCVGPHARYRDLERWIPLIDALLPEATARETIARHVTGAESLARPPEPRPRVTVVSHLFEMRGTLVDACEAAGYPVTPAVDWPIDDTSGLAVWDVPVLEDEWPALLAQQASSRRVVALLGIADRVTVRLARAHGAAACLDLPCDPADLVFVLDRLAAQAQASGSSREPQGEPAHDLPPAPVGLRKPRRSPIARASSHQSRVMVDPRRER